VLCVLQIKSVHAVERAHLVTVTVTKGCIEIQGRHSDVSEATSAIYSILARVREEKFADLLRAEVRHCNNRYFKLVCTLWAYAKLVPM
jgi:hypothetical protein